MIPELELILSSKKYGMAWNIHFTVEGGLKEVKIKQIKCPEFYFKTKIVQMLKQTSTVQHKSNLNIIILTLTFIITSTLKFR